MRVVKIFVQIVLECFFQANIDQQPQLCLDAGVDLSEERMDVFADEGEVTFVFANIVFSECCPFLSRL